MTKKEKIYSTVNPILMPFLIKSWQKYTLLLETDCSFLTLLIPFYDRHSE